MPVQFGSQEADHSSERLVIDDAFVAAVLAREAQQRQRQRILRRVHELTIRLPDLDDPPAQTDHPAPRR